VSNLNNQLLLIKVMIAILYFPGETREFKKRIIGEKKSF
jgi:hypothetical protein